MASVAPEPPSVPDSSGISLDTVAKGAASAVVAAYVVGLLTVSSYLYGFDVSVADPDPLRARFIFTGTGVLLLAGLAFAAPLWATWISGPARADPLLTTALGLQVVRRPRIKVSRTGRAILVVASAVLPVVAVLVLVAGVGDATVTASDSVGAAVAVYVCGFGLGSAVLLTAHHAGRSATSGLPRWTAVLTFAALSALLFGVFIATVSSQVFPQVPRQFGGGQPNAIRLVFTADARAEAHALGLTSDATAYLSTPVQLLFESDKSLVLRRADGRVVETDKQLVRGSGSPGALRPKFGR